MPAPSRFLWSVVLLGALVALPSADAAAAVSFEVRGDSVVGRIQFPPNLAIDVELAFEQVENLTLESLGASARLIDALELVGRLPEGVTASGSIPVLLEIEPPSGGALSFTGVYTLELYTHNLNYLPDSPLRLFKAPLGGVFRDVTTWMGAGSYRVRGTEGDFSQFLILIDGRTPQVAAEAKLTALEDLLAAHWQQLPAGVGDELLEDLDSAWAHYAAGDYDSASQSVGELAQTIEENAGSIPSVWRASRDVVNVGGDLRAAAATAQFTLDLLANQVP